jgi:hypothetical protein
MQGEKMSELEKMGGEELLYIMSDYQEATDLDRFNAKTELLSRLSRLERGERAIKAINKIADIVHNYSCHSAKEAYARITRIVMDNERPREDRNDG